MARAVVYGIRQLVKRGLIRVRSFLGLEVGGSRGPSARRGQHMRFGLSLGFAAVLASSLIGLGCSSPSDAAPTACDAIVVDQFKELLIVDEGVLSDARAKNASDGPWSFRNAIENMAPQGMDPSPFVLEWLSEWDNVREMNGFPADRPNELRGSALQERILCPWLKLAPENACDATCAVCAGRKLDLSRAPFRLIAIANRVDERDSNPGSPQGEGRLVFALTNGVGDDAATLAMPMTVIFEYHLPESRTVTEWATAWHELGKHASFDEPFKADLEKLTTAFVGRGARPNGSNGSALNQIRTNESALNWIWQLREFGLTTDGRLRQRTVRNTPGEALNGSPRLSAWVTESSAAVRSGKFQIPAEFQAPSSDQLLFRWQLPGVDETTRVAFSSATCNGCHSMENPRLDTAFHISPFRSGIDKVSPFLHDPTGAPDELGKRAKGMKSLLCTP